MGARRKTWPPQELWLVFVDHSLLGVWMTEAKAEAAVALRKRNSLLEVTYRIERYQLAGGSR